MKIFLKIFLINLFYFGLYVFHINLYSQQHLGIVSNFSKNININYYSYNIGFQYYSKLSKKYKLILFRENYFGLNNQHNLNIKTNIFTLLILKILFDSSKPHSYLTSNDRKKGTYSILLSLFFPNGVLFTTEYKNKFEYGIIISPFSIEYSRFSKNQEMSNYVFEIGIPVFIHSKKYQHFSVQFFTSYLKNLSSKSVTPPNFSNNNFSFRVNISYIFGIKLKNDDY